MYSAYVGVNGTATSCSRASSGSAAALVIVAAAARRHDVRPDVAPAAADRRDVIARELRGAELQPAIHAEVRVALEQRAVVQRRRIAFAVALERVRVAVRRDDRVHLDDAAVAGLARCSRRGFGTTASRTRRPPGRCDTASPRRGNRSTRVAFPRHRYAELLESARARVLASHRACWNRRQVSPRDAPIFNGLRETFMSLSIAERGEPIPLDALPRRNASSENPNSTERRMPLSIGVLKETFAHEARVALTPDVAAKFVELGVAVHMERGAGERSHFGDALFKGVQFHAERRGRSRAPRGVLLKVQPPTLAEVDALPPGAVVVGFMQPHRELELVRALRDRRITSFAVELIPRISRAQSMDALSSQAAAAGYKAALLAANALDKFLPMLTTAAGTIRPAQVLVIGAGVAGLQAIATARRLGAIVEGVRRALGDEGADPIARREVRRHRRRGRGHGRLCARAHGRGEGQAAGDPRSAHRESRRRDHDGRDPGPHGAAHHLEERGRGDGRRRRHRRSRRRERRQLRAHGRRRDRRDAERREDPRAAQSAVGARAAREPDVRAQSAELPARRRSRTASSRSIGRTRCSRSPC